MFNRFELFDKNYNDALRHIREILESKDNNVRFLANWLLNTKYNPYTIFPDERMAANMTSGEGFSALLSCVAHAFLDDGDIEFPVVNGAPRIIFVHKQDARIEDVLTPYEVTWKKRFKMSDIVWLKDAFEFAEQKRCHERDTLRAAFLHDCRHGEIVPTVKHYEKLPEFDPLWIAEAYRQKDS